MLTADDLCWGDLHYEERVTVFYDVLGWKREIEAAGNSPKHVARLAAAVRMFASQVGRVSEEGAIISTFSDNLVFSKRYKPNELWWSLHGAAVTQLGLAMLGFFIRGGVTIGPLHHDQHIVFGPALNTAYDLESKKAVYPRIIIDPAIVNLLPSDLPYVEEDTDYTFIDPFKPAFFDHIQQNSPIQRTTLNALNVLHGTSFSTSPVSISGNTALFAILQRLRVRLSESITKDQWDKNAWLFDRIAPRINVPISSASLSKNYPH